jgi:hypothetical protein
MMFVLMLLVAGLFLGLRFEVYVLVPIGIALTAALLAWWCFSSVSAAAGVLNWIACVVALNVGYLLGSVVRSRRPDDPSGSRFPLGGRR